VLAKLARPPLRRVFLNWLPVVMCMGLIAYLSSQPRLPQPISASTTRGELTRQTIHMIEYAALTILTWRALAGGDRKGRDGETRGKAHRPPHILNVVIVSLAIVLIYAMLDEWHQHFIPNRDSSLADVAADGAGAGIVIVVLVCLRALKARYFFGKKGGLRGQPPQSPPTHIVK
jgi:VanZ family protein